jgi:hypothetical protein
MRWSAVLALLAAVLGCGGTEPPSAAPRDVAAVKSCLESKGLEVVGGAFKPAPGDADAPDRGQLITRGALIGFYSSAELAEQRAEAVRRNARRMNGTLERHGDAGVIYLDNSARPAVTSCLRN